MDEKDRKYFENNDSENKRWCIITTQWTQEIIDRNKVSNKEIMQKMKMLDPYDVIDYYYETEQEVIKEVLFRTLSQSTKDFLNTLPYEALKDALDSLLKEIKE